MRREALVRKMNGISFCNKI